MEPELLTYTKLSTFSTVVKRVLLLFSVEKVPFDNSSYVIHAQKAVYFAGCGHARRSSYDCFQCLLIEGNEHRRVLKKIKSWPKSLSFIKFREKIKTLSDF